MIFAPQVIFDIQLEFYAVVVEHFWPSHNFCPVFNDNGYCQHDADDDKVKLV